MLNSPFCKAINWSSVSSGLHRGPSMTKTRTTIHTLALLKEDDTVVEEAVSNREQVSGEVLKQCQEALLGVVPCFRFEFLAKWFETHDDAMYSELIASRYAMHRASDQHKYHIVSFIC